MANLFNELSFDTEVVRFRQMLATRSRLPIYRSDISELLRHLLESTHKIFKEANAEILLSLSGWKSKRLSTSNSEFVLGVAGCMETFCFPSKILDAEAPNEFIAKEAYLRLSNQCTGSIGALLEGNRPLSKGHIHLFVPHCDKSISRKTISNEIWAFRQKALSGSVNNVSLLHSDLSIKLKSLLANHNMGMPATNFLTNCYLSLQKCWFFQPDNWPNEHNYFISDLCEFATTQLVTGSGYWVHIFFLGADTSWGMSGTLILHSRENLLQYNGVVSALHELADITGRYLLTQDVEFFAVHHGETNSELSIAHDIDTPISVLQEEYDVLSESGKLAVDYLEIWRRFAKRDFNGQLPKSIDQLFDNSQLFFKSVYALGHYRAKRRNMAPRDTQTKKQIATAVLLENSSSWLDVDIKFPAELFERTSEKWVSFTKTWLLFFAIGAAHHTIAYSFEKCHKPTSFDDNRIRRSLFKINFKKTDEGILLQIINRGDTAEAPPSMFHSSLMDDLVESKKIELTSNSFTRLPSYEVNREPSIYPTNARLLKDEKNGAALWVAEIQINMPKTTDVLHKPQTLIN